MARATLNEANLCGVNFSSADLRGANLASANLEKANFKDAYLTELFSIMQSLLVQLCLMARLTSNQIRSCYQHSKKANIDI
jgi:uncharacterized protein YjbI with pentapeptide repeats